MRQRLLLGLALCMFGLARAEDAEPQVRNVTVAADVDVVVAGGSCAAVAAACAAADAGASVMLLAPRPYLGDDLCGRQALWLEPGETPDSELARALFPAGRVTTPFTVKRALDQALLKHGVRWLTGCCAAELLLSGQNRAGGLIMLSRSGCQAVRAKAVIDATGRALLARQGGAAFRPCAPGPRELQFVVVGGPLRSAPGVSGCALDVTFRNPGKSMFTNGAPVFAYTARAELKDDSFAAWARAEQELRNKVCGPGMLDCAEAVTSWPSDTIIGERRVEGLWPGDGLRDLLGAFRVPSLAGLYVLSAYADVEDSAQLSRPLTILAVAGRVGTAAAIQAKSAPNAQELRPVMQSGVRGPRASHVRGPRNTAPEFSRDGLLRAEEPAWPVLGTYDVVVVGGGTAGAPAGLAAARSGARTLVVEELDELGGVGTAGVIGAYWYGVREGFTKEIDEALRGEKRWPDAKKGEWNLVQKSEWLRRELVKAGADVWFGCLGCGALTEGCKVTGVAVATPMGCGVVKASVVIDATGNADIADCAGADTAFGTIGDGMLSVQLAGYPPRNLGDSVNNTCFALIDDTSALDVWHLMAWGRQRLDERAPYDTGQLVDSRERRRIVADYTLSVPDILNHRTFADTLSHHKSNFDAAAFPTSPLLLVKDVKGPAFEVDMPYRSLLPKGVDGVLVTGLGAGAERDAMTLVRMQADLQNQGYAAGVAAAMAAQNGGHTREVDIKVLQRALVEKGVLRARVLTDKEAGPATTEALAKAVAELGALRNEISQKRAVEEPAIFSLALVMANPGLSLPHLRAAYETSQDPRQKLVYARVLGVFGDKTGAPALIAELERREAWDEGYGLTSHRESDNTFSEMDRVIIALGYSGSQEGVAPLVRKVGLLRPESRVSHFIAAAMALHRLGNPPAAAEPLAKLLREPDFAGHAQTQAVDEQHKVLTARDTARDMPETSLNAAYKELFVAGLLAQCGDSQGVGRRALEAYAQGVSGALARYARHALRQTAGQPAQQ